MNDLFPTLDDINSWDAQAAIAYRRWQEVELPKMRDRIMASGCVTREALQDNLVSINDLLSDPFEIWRCEGWNGNYGWFNNWYRVEIEA